MASAVAPTSTSFPSNCRTSAAPDSTSAADTEARRGGVGEVDPDAAVRLSGNGEVADDHRLDTERAGANRYDGLLRGHAKHLDRERGHEQARHLGDGGHAPDHTALEVHVHEAVARRRCIDHIHAPELSEEAPDARDIHSADDAHGHAAPRRRRVCRRLLDPGHTQHDGPPTKDRREHAVVARQGSEPPRELRVEAGDEPRQPVRGQAIGLGHHDVEPDRGGPPRPISSTSRARSVRGHGHWP